MVKEKASNVEKETPCDDCDHVSKEVFNKYREKFNKFDMKYSSDMAALNRILSNYEDEINSLKQLVFDLSFKIKQLQSIQTQSN